MAAPKGPLPPYARAVAAPADQRVPVLLTLPPPADEMALVACSPVRVALGEVVLAAL
jgi:hypothetical protein